MPKLFSDNLNQTALTGPEIGTVIGRLTIYFPQRAGNDPEAFPLAILTSRWKNAFSFSLTIQKDRAAQQKRETTLKSVYRCPIPFASSWFYRSCHLANVELPEGFKGQNGQRKMSLSSIGN
jgi:hypothetical protein